ncbi:cytochrome P450 1A1-like isoform X1 [Stylophora pistillata]|uniref:cytochrome P450 1A1-like isoform X1 n=1 Tax=Stylophora pistillata TaxID=50429 RepID=UPI000C04177A|nr:cytochrome P450 1A1-like isoform X1 [Stylophora pistillata]
MTMGSFSITDSLSAAPILLFCFMTCFFLKRKSARENSFSNLPPGPWGLPAIGACFRVGRNPHIAFTKMADKYGDVFSLMLGNRLVVVLNGFNVIQETIIKKPTVFAGRPRLYTFDLANPDGNSLTVGDYTPQWRLSRKMSVAAVHNFAKDTSSLEKKLFQESERLICCLKQQKGKAFDVRITLKFATANIILNALFGINRSYDDQDLRRILELADNYREAVHGSSHIDFLPFLKHLPNRALTKLVLALKEVSAATKKMFLKNKETYTEGQVRNIADGFINVLEKETMKEAENGQNSENTQVEMSPLLNDEQIVQVLTELFGASLDTSSITVYWGLAYLIKHPEIQCQLQDELDNVIGRDRLPTLTDIPSLPLLQATVYELLRVTSVAPLAIPHSTTTETTIRDFTIPKDTMVFINLWSLHRDPAIWKDPDVFNPRRFLNGAGELIDPKTFGGFLPFSGGRRRCPGESLAMKTLPVFLAALLHSFRFSQDGLPAEYQGINLEGHFGLTLMPEKFFTLIEERS